MKYDIARTSSSIVKVIESNEDLRLVQLEINPKSSFTAADLDNAEDKLSEVSIDQFKKRSKLNQLELLGIEHDNFSAAFKIKDAELLDNGNFLLDARLLQSPKRKNKKWNRADHIGKDYTDGFIKEPSTLPKKFKANTVFDFEGFKEAKEHVEELQEIDHQHEYSNLNSTSTSKRRIRDKDYRLNSNLPVYFGHDTGFGSSAWYSPYQNNPDAYVGSPWLVNADLNQNSPFYEATGYPDPSDVVQDNYWPWRNVWGILKDEDGSLYDLNKELQLDVLTAQIWSKTLPLAENINLDLTLDFDIMPGAQLFVPAGFWSKLDPENWAAAAGLSLRPRATAKLSGFDQGSYDLSFENQNFQLLTDSVECGEFITCGISGGVDVEVDGTVGVTGGDMELELGVQGGVVGRLGGIYNFDKSYGGAVGFSQTGFNDSITGGDLSVTIAPELTFNLGVGVPSSFTSAFNGWLGNGNIAELSTTLEVPLRTDFHLDDALSGKIPVIITGDVKFIPSLKILPQTSLQTDIPLGGPITIIDTSYTIDNIL